MTKLNYNIKLDIPQDADSVRYFIPKGYTARIEDGVLIIEPKESEDERIRKGLIALIKLALKDGSAVSPGSTATKEDALAYLEKQKEQKPVHFELKAGKWYICHRAFCCRADHLTVKEGERFQCEKDGIVKGFVIKEPEKYFKECSAPAPMEDEQKEQKPADDKAFEEWVDGWWEEHKDKAYHEVTMDKKEFKNFCRGIRNMCQYNSEWSEEDEKMVETICKEGDLKPSEQRWLNSLKNRGNSPKSNDNSPIKDDQPAPEDSVIFQNGVAEGRRLEREEQKPEWSEEDERRYNQVVYLIEQYGGFQSESLYYQDKTIVGGGPKYILKSEVLDWFKSLKNRGNFPSWKPSEEELEALNYAIAEWDGGKRLEGLYALRNDLKKLI